VAQVTSAVLESSFFAQLCCTLPEMILLRVSGMPKMNSGKKPARETDLSALYIGGAGDLYSLMWIHHTQRHDRRVVTNATMAPLIPVEK
jgi:hypothetical protein